MKAESAPTTYRKLLGSMFRVLLLFGLLPTAAMGLAGIAANQAGLEARARNVLEAMVKNRRATIELFLEEKLRDLDLVAASLPVAELSNPVVIQFLLDQMRQGQGAIIDLGLIGGDGRHIAYAGPYSLEDQDYSGEDWFHQAMVRGRYESDVFLGFRRFPHMVMAVTKRSGDRAFILRATIDTDRLSDLVREGGLESGADVFILNRAGEYQTRYSPAHRLMEKADLGPIPVHTGVRMLRQDDQLVANAWLRGERWVLVARQALPGDSIADVHPALLWGLLACLGLVPLSAALVARYRLRQLRGLQAERAALYESVAQSQKMAAIGRLAAGVAHEINNPLAIIQAQVGVLADALADGTDFPRAGEFRDRLGKIEAQVERGRKVTHRLLGFSRRVGPDLEPVDVAAALEETVGFVEREIQASDIRIVRDYGPGVPILRSSLSRMQQVFLNLINNAVDAMGRDGQLGLAVRAAGGGVEVVVADDGPGIPAGDLQRVFEPFYSTKSGPGIHSGLGLALCREIMHGLGGRIGVESAPGRGTTFTLWFPLEPENA